LEKETFVGNHCVYRFFNYYQNNSGNKSNYSFDTVTRGIVTEVVTETGNVSISGEYDIPPRTGFLSEIDIKTEIPYQLVKNFLR